MKTLIRIVTVLALAWASYAWAGDVTYVAGMTGVT